LAKLSASTKQAVDGLAAHGKGSAGSKGAAPTVNVTNNITFTGMESVETAIRKALEAFSRDLDGRLSAIRDQQARLSFGG
jgi:hypothetical protein